MIQEINNLCFTLTIGEKTIFLTLLSINQNVPAHVTAKNKEYSIPAIRGGFVPCPPANPENPRIIDAVLKHLCMILYTLKYAF